MTRKPFKVESKEEGRGKAHRESFATLTEARDYIRDRWQGAEYIDGPGSFHTDYCTWKLVGFSLADIGKRRHVNDEFGGWLEWDWLPLDGDPVAALPAEGSECQRTECPDDSCDLTHCRGCGCHMLLWDREPRLAVCEVCDQKIDDGDDITIRILEQAGILKPAPQPTDEVPF